MAFQAPPIRRVRIQYDIDVAAGDPTSPSSSLSSSVQFSVTFAVRDYDTLCYGGANPSARFTDDPTPAIRSPTVVLSPPLDRPGCWDPAEAALAGLGLESGARDEVMGALRARLSGLVDDEKVMASSSSSSLRLRVDVNIKRLITSLFYNPMYLIGQYRRSTDGASSARCRAEVRANNALDALERVTSEESLQDESCAICLEELKCIAGADEERERRGIEAPVQAQVSQGMPP